MSEGETVAEKKIGVLIVAYNAVSTLAKVLDRIPADLREKIAEVFVFDDCHPFAPPHASTRILHVPTHRRNISPRTFRRSFELQAGN